MPDFGKKYAKSQSSARGNNNFYKRFSAKNLVKFDDTALTAQNISNSPGAFDTCVGALKY
jgi:hypothetical protein